MWTLLLLVLVVVVAALLYLNWDKVKELLGIKTVPATPTPANFPAEEKRMY